MRTYAESRGQAPFNWNEALLKCLRGEIKKGSYEHDQMIDLASDWVTCACGNQCEIIPRRVDNAPKDLCLFALGTRFFFRIDEFRIGPAIEILQQIEKRSAELINEIQNGKRN